MNKLQEDQTFFATYIINEYARAKNISTPQAFKTLDELGIVEDYLIKHYEVLHTLGTEYLVDDISQLMSTRQTQAGAQ